MTPVLVSCIETETLGEICVFQNFVFPSIKKNIYIAYSVLVEPVSRSQLLARAAS